MKDAQYLIELTPELKQRLAGVCDKVIDLLKRETSSPAEAFIVLQFARESLEEMTGFHMEEQIISKGEA